MEYKEHKKMYKVGKNWAVATLVSASILMGGVVTAHANQVESNNYDGAAAVNTERQANGQIGVDGKIISANSNATSGPTNQESSATNNTENAVVNESKNTNNTENDNSQLKLTNNEQPSAATQANLKKLKPQAAKAVQNAKIDAGSLTDDQINELNKINFSNGPTNQESSATNNTENAVVNESKNTNNTENDNSQLKLTNNEQPSAATQANLKKLKPQAAKAVQNAKIDAGSLTDDQINELNKINFSKSAEKGAKLTFKDLEEIGNAIVKQDPQYAIPYFNAKEIKNMPATYTVDAQTGKMAHLDVWDSWPVQDPVTGYVSNYKGYQLVIAMMGIPNSPTGDNHIYLLYSKYGDNDFSHWRNAGSIFGTKETNVFQEWSGSAIVNDDGTIQLFFTSNDTSDYKLNDQRLATATLNLNVDDNGVSIKSVDNYQVLFEGDGIHYQTYEQFANGKDHENDDYCLRDPHVVQLENGDRYLVFEANTGTEDYQSDGQIYNWANYGGDDAFNIKSFFKLLNNKKDRELAGLANGALGILKLTNNQTKPKVEEVYSPLVSTLMASDEVERPNVVKLGDKYYLFSVTRVSRGSDRELTAKDNTIVGDNVAMIGYVSDSLMGKYKPLNNSGVVLTASVPANWRTATYSYYAVPVEGHPDQVLITSYMSNKDFASGEGNYATWAPSFLVQINPDDTTTVLARATNQGDWVWDNSSRNDNMLGVLKEGAANSAALPGEWGKPVDWSLINRSSGLGLKPHQPVQPKIGQPDQQPGSHDLPDFKLPDNSGDKPADNTTPDNNNVTPSAQPSGQNTKNNNVAPSAQPSGQNTKNNNVAPSAQPSGQNTKNNNVAPSAQPSGQNTKNNNVAPSAQPSGQNTKNNNVAPSAQPSGQNTKNNNVAPSAQPSGQNTKNNNVTPSAQPSGQNTKNNNVAPSAQPSGQNTKNNNVAPSAQPSGQNTKNNNVAPSAQPSGQNTKNNNVTPSAQPSGQNTKNNNVAPSAQPSGQNTKNNNVTPSAQPSGQNTKNNNVAPSAQPSGQNTKNNNVENVTTGNKKQSKGSDAEQLPQTGNKSGLAGLYVGSLLALFGLAAIEKRHA